MSHESVHPIFPPILDAIAPKSDSDYRDLVRDCALEVDAGADITLADLPELCAEDIELIRRTHGLAQFLKDVQAEAEIQNERRAQARDEDYYGSGSPQTERERLEVEFGVRSLFRC